MPKTRKRAADTGLVRASTRLAVATDTCLRLKLGLDIPSHLDKPLPYSEAQVLLYLKLTADGSSKQPVSERKYLTEGELFDWRGTV